VRLLLASLLALVPLIAHAEDLGTLSTNEVDPNFLPDPFGTVNPSDPNSVTNELGPYGNPYSPSSATNFEAITAPPLSVQERNDQGWLSRDLSNFELMSKSFDWYGIEHSFRSDSPTNPYGRGWRIEGR
jgi:hypothetical protein